MEKIIDNGLATDSAASFKKQVGMFPNLVPFCFCIAFIASCGSIGLNRKVLRAFGSFFNEKFEIWCSAYYIIAGSSLCTRFAVLQKYEFSSFAISLGSEISFPFAFSELIVADLGFLPSALFSTFQVPLISPIGPFFCAVACGIL